MPNKKTVNTVMLVIYLTIFSKLFGLLRDVLIGARYGTSLESDAYFAAYRMTITIFLSLGTAVTAVTIPFIVKHLQEKRGYQVFTNPLITVVSTLTLGLCALGMLAAPVYTGWIAIGFEGGKLALAVSIVRVFMPVVVLVPLVYIFVSILQSMGKFSVTSLISIPYNLVLIGYLVFLNRSFGIIGLAGATLVGWGGQFLLLYVFVRRERFSYRFKWDLSHPDVRMFFKLLLPILLSSAVYNINVLVDSSIASTLADGQLAALNFANIAYTAVATTTIFGISTVLFPQFASLIASGRMEALRNSLAASIRVMLFIFMPIIFGMLAVNEDLIRLLYQRGTFDAGSVRLTASALAFYTVGMVGFSIQELSNKVFYALKDTRTPFVTSVFSVSLNIVLNLMLVGILGIRGLALATSTAVTVNGLVMLYWVQRRIGHLDGKGLAGQFLRVLAVSLTMFLAVMAFNRFTEGFLPLAPRFAAAVLLGVFCYYGISARMGFEEIDYIKNEMLSGVLSRRRSI